MSGVYDHRQDAGHWLSCNECEVLRDYRELVADVAASVTAWREQHDRRLDQRANPRFSRKKNAINWGRPSC